MLLAPKAIDAVISVLTPEDFYRPSHGTIYAAIVEVHTSGDRADVVTVDATLRARGLADEDTSGGVLTSLMANAPTTSSAPTYARIITEHARRRRMIGLAAELAESAYAGDEGGVARAAEQIVSLPEVGRVRVSLEDVSPAIRGEEPDVLPTMLRFG